MRLRFQPAWSVRPHAAAVALLALISVSTAVAGCAFSSSSGSRPPASRASSSAAREISPYARPACWSDMKLVQTAAEAYYALHGQYAATMADLVSANLLREQPSSSDYVIRYRMGAGTSAPIVTGTLNSAPRTAC